MNTTEEIIQLALFEDSGFGDITTESILLEPFSGNGIIVAKESFILAGTGVAKRVFKLLDKNCEIFCPYFFKPVNHVRDRFIPGYFLPFPGAPVQGPF